MLKLTNVTKTFNAGTINAKTALSNVSLEVHDGDFVTIIGSNGAGKSTLFNAISGVFFTDEGRIELDGMDITMMAEHNRAKSIGRLFQDPMLGSAPGMSVEENLALAAGGGGWLKRVSKKEKDFFREKLALLDMGLEDRMKNPVGLLSGGQRQALTLMMATINPPKLLLLDEHTAALDPATAKKVMEITKDVVEKEHITCMMITHNLESALKFGNRTLMMDNGNIIFDVSGTERDKLSIEDLMNAFKTKAGHILDNDRILLKKD